MLAKAHGLRAFADSGRSQQNDFHNSAFFGLIIVIITEFGIVVQKKFNFFWSNWVKSDIILHVADGFGSYPLHFREMHGLARGKRHIGTFFMKGIDRSGGMKIKKGMTVYCGDCADWLKKAKPGSVDLSFLDPPFNQGKEYRKFDDKQDDADYWRWMTDILLLMRQTTTASGWVYFMQREKNAEFVLRALRESGWTFKSLIVWKKKTSAVPCSYKFGLNYQIIAAAVNGNSPRVFNRLRISPPLPSGYKPRENGIYVTDVWDDIRELTAGYFAGTEAIRNDDGERFHKQQAPLALLVRIILSASRPGDVVFDPFSGTGTTSVAASLLGRKGIGVEIDPLNADCAKSRILEPRQSDINCIRKLYESYGCTENLDSIWGGDRTKELAAPVANEISNSQLLTV